MWLELHEASSALDYEIEWGERDRVEMEIHLLKNKKFMRKTRVHEGETRMIVRLMEVLIQV